ncbi:MAG: hypothetical protein K6F86_08585 [Lachnospiraceae bacterium]|nr:hypothetical protein [Lachnospiraceae bacterium]
MLVGTEEANRIAVEVPNEQFLNKANEFFKKITDAKSPEDVTNRIKEEDSDLPFN